MRFPEKEQQKERTSAFAGVKNFFIALLAGAIVLFIALFAYMKAYIPDSLTEFFWKYPEAAGFVLSYPWEHGKSHSIDIYRDMQKAAIPHFLQWDKRWGYETYGDDCMALNGCGPTCLSMVLCGLTGSDYYDPLTVARYSEAHYYYVNGVGTAWALMDEGAQAFGLYVVPGYAEEFYIRQHLSEDSPMICSMEPGDFTKSGHYIVLTGIDSEGKVILNDPNSKRNTARHWTFAELLPQIGMLWTYYYG